MIIHLLGFKQFAYEMKQSNKDLMFYWCFHKESLSNAESSDLVLDRSNYFRLQTGEAQRADSL